MNSKQKYMYCNILLKGTIMFDAFVTRRVFYSTSTPTCCGKVQVGRQNRSNIVDVKV